jgi:hypothetical protein
MKNRTPDDGIYLVKICIKYEQTQQLISMTDSAIWWSYYNVAVKLNIPRLLVEVC